jgi:hypothetical protein
MDQGWHIVIWESDHLVHIAQGEYDDWFAVPGKLYRSEWSKVIRLASFGENES